MKLVQTRNTSLCTESLVCCVSLSEIVVVSKTKMEDARKTQFVIIRSTKYFYAEHVSMHMRLTLYNDYIYHPRKSLK